MTETISFVLAQPSGVGTRIRPLEPAQLRNLLPRLLPPSRAVLQGHRRAAGVEEPWSGSSTLVAFGVLRRGMAPGRVMGKGAPDAAAVPAALCLRGGAGRAVCRLRREPAFLAGARPGRVLAGRGGDMARPGGQTGPRGPVTTAADCRPGPTDDRRRDRRLPPRCPGQRSIRRHDAPDRDGRPADTHACPAVHPPFRPQEPYRSTPSASASDGSEDFRRVATRYHKLARNALSIVALATLVAFWM